MHVEPPSQKLKLNYEKIFQITFFFLMNEIKLVLRKKPMLLLTKKAKKKEG